MHILILSFSLIERDPRVQRQLRALRAFHKITLAGFGDSACVDGNIELVQIGKSRTTFSWKILAFLSLVAGLYRLHYWRQLEFPRRALQQLQPNAFDLVIANDVNTLPLAFLLAGGSPVYLDAHEYSPKQFSSLLWRLSIGRLYNWICKRWLTNVAMMSTVCDGISDLYGLHYGRRADLIVLNAPPLQIAGHLADPAQDSFRDEIRLVHHGSAEPERRLEMMVSMLDFLDERFTLDLYLVDSDGRYALSLPTYCRNPARLRINPPVPMNGIVHALSRFDIGIFLLPPVNPNYQNALPNKFFEFMHAGLAVAIGPSPEMAAIVNLENIGVVAPTFEPASLAKCLNGLSWTQICQMRRNAWAARERYTSQAAEQAIAASVERALTASRRP
jgi:hypothetical protein